MKTLVKDLGYGLRAMRKKPGFALVAVITLAFGIGAGTAIFTVVNAVLLRDLPYSKPDQLVLVWERFLTFGLDKIPASAAEYVDYRNENQVFEQIATYGTVDFNLTGPDQPERVSGAAVTASLFPLLGVEPIAGRTFADEENQAGRDGVTVISNGLWRRRFAADPHIIGQSITLNGRSYSVIGVMPQGFQFPMSLFGIKGVKFTQPAELWVPLVFSSGQLKDRGSRSYGVIGRLKPRETLSRANADVESIAARMQQRFTGDYPAEGWGAAAVSLKEQVVGRFRPVLVVLSVAVALVLLIACANVANLLLARALSREKEVAIRMAVGASRWRIIRQLMVESALLSIFGGAVGMLIAFWGVDLLVSLSAQTLPRVRETSVDWHVLLFSLAVSVLTAVLFGLVPALHTSKPNLGESLKDRGQSSGVGTRRRLSRAIVVGEFALAVTLLISAVLVVRSLWRLQNVNAGFDPNNVLAFDLTLPREGYADRQSVATFYQLALDRIGALPGVEAAGASTILPLSGSNSDQSFVIEGRIPRSIEEVADVEYRIVTPNYFRALAIPILSGRSFQQFDNDKTAGVTIVNQALARRYFPGEDPVGKRVTTDDPREPNVVWLTIVGVSGDVKHRGLAEDPEPEMYVAHQQYPDRSMSFVIRTAFSADNAASAIKQEISALSPNLPVYNIRTMERLISDSIAQQRLSTALFGLFAAIAVALASIGIYGVMAYNVGQRSQEIAIRRALGAEHGVIMRAVIGQGMVMALVGIGIGVGLAVLLGRSLAGLLFGISYLDPATYATVPLGLATFALLATWVPARRAMRVDPISALKYE
ncbi:MAG TPA: ABC transporter permease [Blastocatellia bacterium]|nr:ABC transporter permease [Blastocatellia bacterium]